MEGWAKVALTLGAATADATQLYPNYAAAGTAIASAVTGNQIRCPCEGTLVSLQVETDSTNAGTLELYDMDGSEAGANVSSATAITDAQLDAAITAGSARLIFSQNFAGAGTTPFTPIGPRRFMKGLVGRAVGGAGTCWLNLTVQGGFHYTTKGPAT